MPREATQRTQALAEREGWTLHVIDAGEFDNADYMRNPVNRCFFCKTSLYGSIRPHTAAQIVSGTNLDDLGEYRPGLLAAREHGVRHPFVEAGLRKSDVRALARQLGLGEVAELPASPCLSSRVETGIAIDPAVLALVHATEQLVAQALQPKTVRCRVRAAVSSSSWTPRRSSGSTAASKTPCARGSATCSPLAGTTGRSPSSRIASAVRFCISRERREE